MAGLSLSSCRPDSKIKKREVKGNIARRKCKLEYEKQMGKNEGKGRNIHIREITNQKETCNKFPSVIIHDAKCCSYP